MMASFDEDECLDYNPFEGDFGTPGDVVLRDKFVTARKGGCCVLCLEEIRPGDRVRSLSAVFDGELRSYRWCSACCAAMASVWTDDGDALMSRERVRSQLEHQAAQKGDEL